MRATRAPPAGPELDLGRDRRRAVAAAAAEREQRPLEERLSCGGLFLVIEVVITVVVVVIAVISAGMMAVIIRAVIGAVARKGGADGLEPGAERERAFLGRCVPRPAGSCAKVWP